MGICSRARNRWWLLALVAASGTLCVLAIGEESSCERGQCSASIGQGEQEEQGAFAMLASAARLKRANVDLSSGIDEISDHGEVLAAEVGVQNLSVSTPNTSMVMTMKPIQCNESLYAPSGVCPLDCPFWAEEMGTGKVCHFKCVAASVCGSPGLDPKARIADVEASYCRPCLVAACTVCADGAVDKCSGCDMGFQLTADGQCEAKAKWVFYAVFATVSVLLIVIVAWYVELLWRPVLNADGVEEGLRYRSARKLHTSAAQGSGGRQVWPLSTNLHATDVGGPGLVLHFDFMLAIILWGCGLASLWIVFAYSVNPELLVLGLFPAKTPQEFCAVTLRGHEEQRRLMWAKVMFVAFAYVGTFVGSLIYAGYHLKRFEEIDGEECSMRDFAVVCTGLPIMPGTELVEDEIKEALAKATGQEVVGVSVCWDYSHRMEDVEDALEQDAMELQREREGPPLEAPAPTHEPQGALVRNLRKVDRFFYFGLDPPSTEEKAEVLEPSARQLLETISSTDTLFAVFGSEAARDAAIEASGKAGGVHFRDGMLQINAMACEPDTVRWEAGPSVGTMKFMLRILCAIAAIIVALIVWALGFYVPYAMYSASFNKNGEEPGFLVGFAFSMLVVVGNQIMYFLCEDFAGRVDFRFSDHKESLYIALYTLACFLNLVADLGVEAWMGYTNMVNSGVHTADGRLLSEITKYEEIFESYPMQKILGGRLFAYCWPSCYFLPFLFEPIFGIFLPYHLCKLLTRSRPEVRGREAEKAMDFFAPMDLARYADILLNVMLATMILFFPPGDMLKLLLAFIVSHLFIYFYDQYRVLRCVPRFDFASNVVDQFAQGIMAFPCGLMAAVVVFKANCLIPGLWCIEGGVLLAACVTAFAGSILVHWFLLFGVVPRFVQGGHDLSTRPYADVASETPLTWFSANPVHCLRSKHLYQHSPPVDFFQPGKEHLMRASPKLGQHYEDCVVGEGEDFSAY